MHRLCHDPEEAGRFERPVGNIVQKLPDADRGPMTTLAQAFQDRSPGSVAGVWDEDNPPSFNLLVRKLMPQICVAQRSELMISMFGTLFFSRTRADFSIWTVRFSTVAVSRREAVSKSRSTFPVANFMLFSKVRSQSKVAMRGTVITSCFFTARFFAADVTFTVGWKNCSNCVCHPFCSAGVNPTPALDVLCRRSLVTWDSEGMVPVIVPRWYSSSPKKKRPPSSSLKKSKVAPLYNI